MTTPTILSIAGALIMALIAVVCCLIAALMDSRDLVKSLRVDLSLAAVRRSCLVIEYTRAVEHCASLNKALRDRGDTTE